MPILSKVLRPGLLVGLSTAIKGDNVSYDKTVLEEEHIDASGALVGSWQTDKTVIDAAEHERAVKVRSKARNLVTGICGRSDFGYLCPDNKQAELEAAVAEGARICTEFNITASVTEIKFSVLTGRIAADDAAAVRAIKGELNGLLEAMDAGIKSLDVGAVRELAKKTKKLGTMLQPDAQARLETYLKEVRAVATKMNTAGEQAAAVVDEEVIKALTNARTAFLDLDESAELQDSKVEGRALDFDLEVAAPEATVAVEAPTRDIDVDDLM